MTVFGKSDLSPTYVLAGDSVEFIIHLEVGDDYSNEATRLVVDFPGTLGMSRPSRMHQEDHGFVTVRVSNPDVTYKERIWDMEITDFASRTRGSWRGMAARMAVVELGAGLNAGDSIEIRWGASTGGYGSGTKVTTVVPRPDYHSVIHVRYFADASQGVPDLGRSFVGYERPTPDTVLALPFQVAPRTPHHLRLFRRADYAMLVPYDTFWNITPVAEINTLVESNSDGKTTPEGTISYADKNVSIQTRGMTLTETPTMEQVFEDYSIYWGDIHSHSATSNDCIEREKMDMAPGDLMHFARERAMLDFYATTDHHQPWDQQRNRIGESRWSLLLDAVRNHHEDGAFVVFPGFEYRCPRGDTVVLFNGLPSYAEIDNPEWIDVRKLWQTLSDRDILTIPHFHNPGKLSDGEWWSPADMDKIEPVLEIFSCHGSYEREDALERHTPLVKARRPDRFGAWFLEQGYHVGLVANSDGHKGHVGSNGLTAVYANSLDRDSLFEAYRQRHVYGTTNARLRMLFTANGQLMGSRLSNSDKKYLHIDVTGENTLKKVELFHSGGLYQRFAPGAVRFTQDVIIDDPSPGYWYVRATQLDNHIGYTSPVWFG